MQRLSFDRITPGRRVLARPGATARDTPRPEAPLSASVRRDNIIHLVSASAITRVRPLPYRCVRKQVEFLRNLLGRITSRKSGFVAKKKIVNCLPHHILRRFLCAPIVNRRRHVCNDLALARAACTTLHPDIGLDFCREWLNRATFDASHIIYLRPLPVDRASNCMHTMKTPICQMPAPSRGIVL